MDDFHKQNRHGPGGYHCPCCGPHNSKARRLDRKLARRRLKRNSIKDIKNQQIEMNEKEK